MKMYEVQKIQSLPSDIRHFLDTGLQHDYSDRFDIGQFTTRIGFADPSTWHRSNQPVSLAIDQCNRPTSIDGMWSEYTTENSETPKTHNKETILFEEVPSKQTIIVPEDPPENLSHNRLNQSLNLPLKSANRPPSQRMTRSRQTPPSIADTVDTVVQVTTNILKVILYTFSTFILFMVGIIVYSAFKITNPTELQRISNRCAK